MVINVSVGGQIPQAPGTKSGDFPVVIKTESTPSTNSNNGSSAPVQGANDFITFEQAEQQRLQAIEQASRNFFKDVYAVSDTSFTIYKDQSGQFITRYTSLRDGKVTYVPEQTILQYAQLAVPGGEAFIKIRV